MFRLYVSVSLLLASASSVADQVVVHGASGSPVVVVDAVYSSVCENDRVFTPGSSAGVVDIGNADSAAGCRGDVMVFSEADAAALVSQPALTSANDTLDVNMRPRLPVPVYTWVLRRQPLSAPDQTDLIGIAEAELIAADLAFAGARTGIAFVNQGIGFAVDPQWVAKVEDAAQKAADGLVTGRAVLDAIRSNTLHSPQPEGVNLYRLALPIRGFHISKDDHTSSGVLVLGAVPVGNTLGHELGHAMSLDHVNFVGRDWSHEVSGEFCSAYGNPDYYDGRCDFTTKNLMWAGGLDGRDELTLGQALRTILNSRSFLNSHVPPLRDPGEPRRDCADWREGEQCPYIGLEQP